MIAYLIQSLSGLAYGATLFLVAAGLSIIFGVTRIVNFAHGSLYMLGAYLAYSMTAWLKVFIGGATGFWLGVLLAALLVGVTGALMEVLILRRTYHAPELLQLLATFAVVLVVQDATLWLWGREDLLAPRVPGLRGTVTILGERFPQYHLVLIALGPIVLGLLWLLFRRTRWGVLVRAATQDRQMAGALGVNQRLLFTGVFFLGSALAGLAGALQIPKEAVNLHMDLNIITETFVVVVVGGMGSLLGAFLAAMLIGQIHAFGVLFFPQATLVLIFLVMAVVLVVRPHGLLGKAGMMVRYLAPQSEAPIARASPRLRQVFLAIVAVLVAAPWILPTYGLHIVTEICILALFAASLHFIMQIGGMISFGHAAYFGLGAYTVALLTKQFGLAMEFSLPSAMAVAAIMALVFGWFCIRLSGVYLAMLTLAFAQILWSVVFQSPWTGGDNGILGVWPGDRFADPRHFFYLVLALTGFGCVALRRVIFAPFGYGLRAGRDSVLRSEAIGIDVRRQQWYAFALSGALAGLAGALFAYHNGNVFPTVLGIGQSVDALVMVLLGGLQSLSGPLLGAGVFHLLKTEAVRVTEYWRLIMGVVILILVIAFPQGLAGIGRKRRS